MSILEVTNELEELNLKLLSPTCCILMNINQENILQYKDFLCFFIHSIYTFKSLHLWSFV